MTTLSQSLLLAAAKAENRAEEAIADGDAEGAEVALRSAATFRRLAVTHRAKAILSGDPGDDPHQVVNPASSPITGAEVRARREALGLSQEQLARQLDVAANTVLRWEHGKTEIAHPGMLRLAFDALDMQKG